MKACSDFQKLRIWFWELHEKLIRRSDGIWLCFVRFVFRIKSGCRMIDVILLMCLEAAVWMCIRRVRWSLIFWRLMKSSFQSLGFLRKLIYQHFLMRISQRNGKLKLAACCSRNIGIFERKGVFCRSWSGNLIFNQLLKAFLIDFLWFYFGMKRFLRRKSSTDRSTWWFESRS